MAFYEEGSFAKSLTKARGKYVYLDGIVRNSKDSHLIDDTNIRFSYVQNIPVLFDFIVEEGRDEYESVGKNV